MMKNYFSLLKYHSSSYLKKSVDVVGSGLRIKMNFTFQEGIKPKTIDLIKILRAETSNFINI